MCPSKTSGVEFKTSHGEHLEAEAKTPRVWELSPEPLRPSAVAGASPPSPVQVRESRLTVLRRAPSIPMPGEAGGDSAIRGARPLPPRRILPLAPDAPPLAKTVGARSEILPPGGVPMPREDLPRANRAGTGIQAKTPRRIVADGGRSAPLEPLLRSRRLTNRSLLLLRKTRGKVLPRNGNPCLGGGRNPEPDSL